MQPPDSCSLCPRLMAFRQENRQKFTDFFNSPVPSFGPLEAELLVVGLAPGLKGANASGRPFTGDYAGEVLYPALLRYGFAQGTYRARPDDGLELVNCRITNAVRCVPPANKPETMEIHTCNGFLTNEIKGMPRLKTILSLGHVAHKAVLKASGMKQSAYAFGHGREHCIPGGIRLVNSYHCSRYNINTNVLTVEMFDDVLKKVG